MITRVLFVAGILFTALALGGGLAQWEYSHAAGAGLYLLALMSLAVAALNSREVS